MSNISSIDDLLMGVGNSQQPATPEHKDKIEDKPEPIEEMDEHGEVAPDDTYDDDQLSNEDDRSRDKDSDEEDGYVKERTRDDREETLEIDEYGNEKPRMPRGVEERLARKDRQYQQEVAQRDQEIAQLRAQLANQGASKEVQQAVKDFKYDADQEAGWEQQLSNFVKNTVNNMHTEEKTKQRQAQEQHQEREFHKKFTQGMDRFSDFRQVVQNQPIDDAMTLALRGMNDPSAFIYAASKRQPQELERISKLADPYARMVEMGKLEERMRRAKPTTKAPRTLGRTRDDTTARVTPKQKEMTGDDLLAKADAKRLSVVKTRHRANR